MKRIVFSHQIAKKEKLNHYGLKIRRFLTN